MNTATIKPQHDPMGAAMLEFYQTGRASQLHVLSSMFDDDTIDVPYLFRTIDEMPKLERKALELARGHVLDVGAGAGCHALALQDHLEVTAIDLSPLSQQVMEKRGVRDARCINLFDFRLEGTYDTILLLMNGTGIIGKMQNISTFFARMRTLLAHDGQVLLDSSDLKYLYEDEDGSCDMDAYSSVYSGYYGEVDYSMTYRDVKGEAFDWLYIDFETLRMISAANGFRCEKVMEGDHYDYLARLTLK